MRIAKLRGRGFRSLRDVELDLDPLTVLIGPNGAGKSALLKALAFFFDKASVDETDLHQPSGAQRVEVEVEFVDVPQELSLYCDSEGRLRAVRQWTPGGKPLYTVHKKMLPGAAAVFQARTAEEAKSRYKQVQSSYGKLPGWTSRAQAQRDLDALAAKHPDAKPQSIQQDNLDFVGEYVDFVFVPAVEDPELAAREDKDSPFNALLRRLLPKEQRAELDAEVQRLGEDLKHRLEDLANNRRTLLADVEERVNSRLQRLYGRGKVAAHWRPFVRELRLRPELSLEESGVTAPVGRQGHGLQRAFLLALLLELAAREPQADETRTLILAIEEPEVYQHPPQGRALAKALREIASPSFQVVYTTHSPVFVSFESLDAVRRVSLTRAEGTTVTNLSRQKLLGAATRARLNVDRHLQLLAESAVAEGLFSHRVVLVEGDEDKAYVEWACRARGLDLVASGAAVIAAGGKDRIILPAHALNQLGIPVFIIFDTDQNKKKERPRHEVLNRELLELCRAETNWPFPQTGRAEFGAWFAPTMKDVVRQSVGPQVFDEAMARARDEWQDGEKSPLVVRTALEIIREQGHQVPALEDLAKGVAKFLSETCPAP